jgi:hypothetical protein
MKTQFKVIAFFLLATSLLFGQEESLDSKSFDINATTTALLKFSSGGGTVEIEESEDDKFYIVHSIEFKNYSNRKKEKVIKEIRNRYEFDAKMADNHITTTYKNKTNRRSAFSIDSYMNSGYIRNNKNDSIINHKLNKAFVDEIIEAKTPGFRFINFITNSKYLSEGRKQRAVERFEKDTNAKTYHVKVKIKVPKNLNVTINSKYTKIMLSGNLKNKFSIRCNGGRLFVDGFENQGNVIKIKDGIILMNSMSGGELTFNNARNAFIGELRDVTLNSEFSKIEIGKIENNVEITDFTSKFIIHNFSSSFISFNMNTEYSEVNMFLPKNMSYYVETFGKDTVHYKNGITTEITPSRINEPSKMMTIGKITNPNKIKINTTHGIIRLGEDSIDFGEEN